MVDKTSVALAFTYHDPPGRLAPVIERILPLLADLFGGIAVQASPVASGAGLRLFQAAGALVQQDQPLTREVSLQLGSLRAAAVRTALRFPADFVLFIDGDRVFHWAAQYPEELAAVVGRLPDADCTVLGRTPRAFASHPRSIQETERHINRLFSQLSSVPEDWDVMVGARGVSRRAAEAVLAGCDDEAISVDVSWLLHLMRQGFALQHIACEGLEFETADRHQAEIDAQGSLAAWLEKRDCDPREWAVRFRIAHLHCEAMAKFRKE